MQLANLDVVVEAAFGEWSVLARLAIAKAFPPVACACVHVRLCHARKMFEANLFGCCPASDLMRKYPVSALASE